MKRNVILWLLALIITLASAAYQRMTGPTYPKKVSIKLNEKEINFKLPRSHGGNDDQVVAIPVSDTNIKAFLVWKRYKTKDAWTYEPMKARNDSLVAFLPGQPPAGKLEYFLVYEKNGIKHTIPEHSTVVIRFKGKVPLWVLIPHIIAMFTAMLFSMRVGLEIFNKEKTDKFKKYTYWTIAFLFIGGFIFGPLMQKYAFGEYWTGVPFGYDLTDNKTLIAMLGWVIAAYMYKKSQKPLRWAMAASLLMFGMYMIPHSVLGSELDYNKLDAQKKHQQKKTEIVTDSTQKTVNSLHKNYKNK